MNHPRLFALLLIVVPSLAVANDVVRERIEWIDIWVTDAEKNELPRVLLVGDSIARGYYDGVDRELRGRAYCARLTTSKCVCDPTFNDDIEVLLKQYSFSVIHFNNGLHGWGYTEEQYENGLKKTLAFLESRAPKSKLIWATTTPITRTSTLINDGARIPRINGRNTIATKLMSSRNVTINDLHSPVIRNSVWHSADGVHYTAQGKAAQATQVAEIISTYLPQK